MNNRNINDIVMKLPKHVIGSETTIDKTFLKFLTDLKMFYEK